MILYRPVGQKELERVAGPGYNAYPPRLPTQPIFYPVLTREYADQIARDWSTRDPVSGFAGFVLRFELEDEYASQFTALTIGAGRRAENLQPALCREYHN
jgi:hypothetical protein